MVAPNGGTSLVPKPVLHPCILFLFCFIYFGKKKQMRTKADITVTKDLGFVQIFSHVIPESL